MIKSECLGDTQEVAMPSEPDILTLLDSFKSCEQPIPELLSYANSNHAMIEIANAFSNLENAKGNVVYSQEAREAIFKGFRIFICYLFKQNESKDNSQSTKISELELKIEEGNQKILKLESSLQQKAIELQKSENKILELELNKLNDQCKYDDSDLCDSRIEDENNKLKESLSKLLPQFQSQAEEIIYYQKINSKATYLLNQSIGLISKYDEIITDIAQNQNEVDNMKELIKQIDELKSENKLIKSNEFKEYCQIKGEITERFGDINFLSEIKSFLQGNEELLGKIKIFQLLNENLLKFLNKLVNSGELEIIFLTPEENGVCNLSLDNSFKTQMLISLARCRQFLLDNKIDVDTNKEHSITDLLLNTKLNYNEILDIFSSQILSCSLYQKLYENLYNEYKNQISELSKIADFLKCDDESCLVRIAVDKLVKIKQYFTEIRNILEDKNTYPMNIDGFLEYISKIINYVKPLLILLKDNSNIDFDSSFESNELLNKGIRKYIESNNQNEKINEIEKMLNDFKDELKNEKENAENYISALKNEIRIKNEEIKRLSINKSQQINNDKLQNSEDDSYSNREEIKELQISLQNSKIKEKQYIDQLNENNLKTSQLKSKYKEFLISYESAFSQQKETISLIKKQNEKLLEIIKQSKKQNTFEINQLKSGIQSLRSEKQILELKMRQISENYRMKILIQKTELKTTYENLLEENKKKYSLFINNICEIIRKHSSSFIKTSEENLIQNIKSILKENQQLHDSINSNNHQNSILQDWDKWSKDVFTNVTGVEPFFQSRKILQFVLSEMIFSSISHKDLLYRLESLRIQKKSLIRLSHLRKDSNAELSFRSLIILSKGIIEIMKKSGHYPKL